VIFVQIGTGENGKTTIALALLGALGPGYHVIVSPRVLLADASAHPTELMDLRGARIGVLEETPEEHKLSVQRLKLVTGDYITARRMRNDPVTWRNGCSVTVNTNYYPLVREVDHGTWRRLAALVYPYTFRKPHEHLRDESDRLSDPGLRDRIAAGSCGEAVLAWLVAGAMRWYQGGRVMGAPPERVRRDTAGWRKRSDLVMAYSDERLVFDGGSFVMATDLRDDMNRWLSGNGHQEWSAELIADRLASHAVMTENRVSKGRRYRTENGLSRPSWCAAVPDATRFAAWSGVRFRTRADDLNETAADGHLTGSAANLPDARYGVSPGHLSNGTGGTGYSVSPNLSPTRDGHTERSSYPSQDHPGHDRFMAESMIITGQLGGQWAAWYELADKTIMYAAELPDWAW